MTRTNSSARKAGQSFERLSADYLRAATHNQFIDIRPKNGTNDRGDLGGVVVRATGEPVVVECKDQARDKLGSWLAEAEREAKNAGARYGVVMHKRARKGQGADQYVTMTAEAFAWLLNGGPARPVEPPHPIRSTPLDIFTEQDPSA